MNEDRNSGWDIRHTAIQVQPIEWRRKGLKWGSMYSIYHNGRVCGAGVTRWREQPDQAGIKRRMRRILNTWKGRPGS